MMSLIAGISFIVKPFGQDVFTSLLLSDRMLNDTLHTLFTSVPVGRFRDVTREYLQQMTVLLQEYYRLRYLVFDEVKLKQFEK